MAGGRPRSFDRDAALRGAMEVFWAKGFEGASLQDLMQAMGIRNTPSVYAAFGDKETLFRSAVDLYAATTGAAPLTALAEADGAREGIRAMLASAAKLFSRPSGPGGCLLVTSAITCTRENEHVAADLKARQRYGVLEALVDKLRVDPETGLLSESEIKSLAEYALTIMLGLAMRGHDGACQEELETVANRAVRAI